MKHAPATAVRGLFGLILAFITFSAGATTYYVDVNSANPTPPYTNWSTAAVDIQTAVDLATNGDLVLVNPGLYQSGGYTAPDGSLTAVVVTNELTLQGVDGASATSIDGSNAMRCVYLANGAALIGFALTNGSATNGGGLYCLSTSDIVSNCAVVNNEARVAGAGAYQGTLVDCSIAQNAVSGFSVSGGGAYNCTLLNCSVWGNSAYGSRLGTQAYGGGACASTLVDCIVTNNLVSGVGNYSYGGGAYNSRLTNCVVADNSISTTSQVSQGGGTYGGSLVNCNITGNSASQGGGTYNAQLINCIDYYNAAGSASTNYSGGALSYCCTTPLPAGTGNITNQPLLASLSDISVNSPCRGAGNAAATGGVDINGNPWANPPSIGCEEPYPGNMTGDMSVTISIPYTNSAPGYPSGFEASISGGVSNSKWDFGDGTVFSNTPYVSHTWTAPGDYPVVLTAYNDSFPAGQSATMVMHIATPTVFYVSAGNQTPLAPFDAWAKAATNIQTVLNLAGSGDFVWVSNGVYNAGGTAISGVMNRVAVTNAITLQSVNGPSVTVIDGLGTVRCVYLTTNAVLNGFTLTNGYAGSSGAGGGVLCAATNVIVTNCYVTHCSAFNGGGAFSGTLYDCTLCNSTAGDYGGGASGGICTLNDCLICSNSAPTGGGVYFFEAGSLNNCVISNNSAQYGGGVYGPDGSQTGCNLSNCLVTLNTAVYYGGGLFNVQIKNSVISSNSQISLSGAGGGADSVWATNCTFIGNSAAFMGGGAACVGGQRTMLFNCELIGNIATNEGGGCSSECIADRCTFLQNITEGSGGGAAGATLANCLIISNVVQTLSGLFSPFYGAGAYACSLTNCLLTENSFTGSSTNILGGGAYDSSLFNCTVISNSAFLGGGIADCQAYNCIVYYNNGGDYGDDSNPYMLKQILDDCCTALAPTNGIWNITNAPLFVNPNAGDFHLQADSPCINSGQNAYIAGTPTDLDGNPRIVGGTVDIGAYEYQTPASVISYAFLQQYGLPTDGSVDFTDLDGTGFTVYQDWIADLNPTNPASVLAMLSPAATNASGVTVTWQSVSGIPYLLQRSTNLLTQQFSTIQSVIGQGSNTSYTDTSATNQVPYFYRVGASR